MRKSLKFTALITVLLYLYGCGIATVSVYDVGAHIKGGSTKVSVDNGKIKTVGEAIPVDIYESDLKPTIGYMAIAYSEEFNRKYLGKIFLKMDGNKWLSKECTSGTGEVESVVGGQPYTFKGTMERVNKSTCRVSLEKMERKPYGYPAQALMVLSVPVDVVIAASFLAASCVATPFLVAYTYLTDTDKKPGQAAIEDKNQTREDLAPRK